MIEEEFQLREKWNILRSLRWSLGNRMIEHNKILSEMHKEDEMYWKQQDEIDKRMAELTGNPNWWLEEK